MKALFHFLFRTETWFYLKWRRQNNRSGLLGMAWEWFRVLFSMRRRKARASIPFDAAQASLTEITEPAFSHYFLQPDQVQALAKAIQSEFPKEASAIVSRAEETTNDGLITLVTGTTIDIRDFGWHPPVVDPEHLSALHRWYFGVDLAKAWAFTGQARYAEQFSLLFNGWVKSNPPKDNEAAWQSYNVSERIVHWCFATTLLWNAPGFQENTFHLMAEQLLLHARYLAAHLETENAHNHLINNARALYTVGLFLRQAQHQTLGSHLLHEHIERQVLADGFFGEQSVPYHFLLTRIFVEVAVLADLAGERVSNFFSERVRKMVETAALFLRSDESCPLIGDVSPDISLEALTGSVAAGQIRLQLKQTAALSEHGAWLAGQVRKPESGLPEGTNTLPEAGYLIYRHNNLHAVFHCDPRAEVFRHGHADALGICLWKGGQEILRDSGNLTYTHNSWRDYFRGPAAHSGISLKGLPCYPVSDFLAPLLSEQYRKGTSHMEMFSSKGAWICASGWHSGYSRLGQNLKISRRLVLNPDYLWVTDWIEGEGSWPFESRWQWEIKPESILWRLNGKKVEPRWVSGWNSKVYGQKVPAKVSYLSENHKGITRLDMVMDLSGNSLRNLVIEPKDHEQVQSQSWTDDFEINHDGRRFEARRLEPARTT